MAKKKNPPKARPEEPRKPVARTPNSLVIRGSAEWRAWLDRYCQFRQTTTASVIAQVLAEAARRDKFDPPPNRL
jgi:hypothetical protein